MKRSRLAPGLPPLAVFWPALWVILVAGCGKPAPFGEPNSLIVAMPDSLWVEVETATYEGLEPTFVTTRPEKKYVVTQVDPTSADFEKLRLWWQVIVPGTLDDPLVQRILQVAGVEDDVTAPRIVQAEDIWARGQLVTAVVLDPTDPAASWRGQLPDLYERIDDGFRRYVRSTMFITGPDSATGDSLRRQFGFTFDIPVVYELLVRDSIVILRNDNPDPGELIRSILVAWRQSVDSLTPELAYEWRAAVDSIHYNVPQRIDLTTGHVRRFEVNGLPALEATGTWADEGTFPAAGPFIVWLVQCPDRTVFIDAWLYAPRKSKYMYMLQLYEILGSFECTEPAAVARAEATS